MAVFEEEKDKGEDMKHMKTHEETRRHTKLAILKHEICLKGLNKHIARLRRSE